MIRTDPSQPHLLDGSIYLYDVRPDGCYVTIKGNSDDRPHIISFDTEDLDVLRRMLARFDAGGFGKADDFTWWCEPSQVADTGVHVGGGEAATGERVGLVVGDSHVLLNVDEAESLIVLVAEIVASIRGDL